MMRILTSLALIAACGGKQQPPPQNDTTAPVTDTRTPLEKRRDAACEKVGAKATQCALDDAKADLAAGKVTKAEFDKNTAPGITRENTAKYIRGCEVPLSSRQVRVLEVCYKSETECEPLLDCLSHINDKAKQAP